MHNKTTENKGFFITFEGLDGCGKSTQIKMAEDYLTSIGKSFVKTINPGGTELGKKLREILLHEKSKIYSDAELLL